MAEKPKNTPRDSNALPAQTTHGEEREPDPAPKPLGRSGDAFLDALESQVNGLLSPNYIEVLDSTPETVLWHSDELEDYTPSPSLSDSSLKVAPDWWEHAMREEGGDGWEIDESLEEGVGLFLQENSGSSQLSGNGAPLHRTETDTIPGMEVEDGSELLSMILSTAQETYGVCVLEILDTAQNVFSELIVDAGSIVCAVFLDGALVFDPSPVLESTYTTRIQEMAQKRLHTHEWERDESWDWTHVPLDIHQRHCICVATIQALMTVAKSPYAQGATIRPRSLELAPGRALSFSPVELSMTVDETLQPISETDPAYQFYLKFAQYAQIGGLLTRDAHLPNLLQPIRMIPQGRQPIQHRTRRFLRAFAESYIVMHKVFGKDGHGLCQINITHDGFWMMLVTSPYAVVLRFPSSFLGRVWGAMLRFFQNAQNEVE